MRGTGKPEREGQYWFLFYFEFVDKVYWRVFLSQTRSVLKQRLISDDCQVKTALMSVTVKWNLISIQNYFPQN